MTNSKAQSTSHPSRFEWGGGFERGGQLSVVSCRLWRLISNVFVELMTYQFLGHIRWNREILVIQQLTRDHGPMTGLFGRGSPCSTGCLRFETQDYRMRIYFLSIIKNGRPSCQLMDEWLTFPQRRAKPSLSNGAPAGWWPGQGGFFIFNYPVCRAKVLCCSGCKYIFRPPESSLG